MHLIGATENTEELTDQSFGATVNNSYRLVRTVEMYQWKENQSTRKEGDRTITTYDYEKNWFEHPISSAGFQERDKQNPTNNWPFHSSTITANKVTMGKFKLN